jgi:CBS domain-containing protein
MQTIEAVRRTGITIDAAQTVRTAAELMEAGAVGALAVVDGTELVGIVTDRDIVRRVVAKGVDPGARIDSVMTAPVVTIDAGADLRDAYALFRTNGLRRLAVVREGRFDSMLTLDDLLIDLAADLSDLARPVTGQAVFGQHDASVPAVS